MVKETPLKKMQLSGKVLKLVFDDDFPFSAFV
jgi:hypothetical protein